jgi:uncharacterized membrane protein YdfJ with MMPL/SSD domain
MFHALGNLVSRAWPLLLGAWIALLIVTARMAPSWEKVAEGGQFAFLPLDAPSNRGKELFKKAFPNEPLGSSAVLVLSRENEQLVEQDKTFIEHDLKPRLMRIAEEEGGLAGPASAGSPDATQPKSIIARVQTLNDKGIGTFLVSEDKKATLGKIKRCQEPFRLLLS